MSQTEDTGLNGWTGWASRSVVGTQMLVVTGAAFGRNATLEALYLPANCQPIRCPGDAQMPTADDRHLSLT